MIQEFKLVHKQTGEVMPHSGPLLHHLVKTGAKVNGKLPTLKTQLQHGDKVNHQGQTYEIQKHEPTTLPEEVTTQQNKYTFRKTRLDKLPLTDVVITNKRSKTKNAKLNTVNGMPLHTALITQAMTRNEWIGTKFKPKEVKLSALIFSRLKRKSK